MSEGELFRRQCSKEIDRQARDETLQDLSRAWMDHTNALRNSYHFTALDRPIIK